MMPVTRARTSTSFEPCVWPTYSNVTGKVFCVAATTVTSAGGKPAKPPPPFGCEGPQAARAAAIESRRNERNSGRDATGILGTPRRNGADCCELLSRVAPCARAEGYIQSRLFVKFNRAETGISVWPAAGTKHAMVRRTKEDAAITREQLLDAAENVFRQRGVARSSLAEVAAAAGVTRGAVCWHFRDKADLCAAMCERAMLPLETMLSEAG